MTFTIPLNKNTENNANGHMHIQQQIRVGG